MFVVTLVLSHLCKYTFLYHMAIIRYVKFSHMQNNETIIKLQSTVILTQNVVHFFHVYSFKYDNLQQVLSVAC